MSCRKESGYRFMVSGSDYRTIGHLYGVSKALICLNVDWFQPFSHLCDFVGAPYLVILNLPRQLSYKKDNIIITSWYYTRV